MHQHLKKLTDNGLILDTQPEKKKTIYALTEKGREMLEKMRDLIDLGKSSSGFSSLFEYSFFFGNPNINI
jgi:DNA-binding PadR family transcriptional regulator